MDRIVATNSVPSSAADAPPSTGTPQFATNGNPATGTPATVFPAYAFNAIQEELIALIVAGGATPSRFTAGQVAAAVLAIASGTSSIAASGYLKLPGGLILQWGTMTFPNSGTRTSGVTVSLPIAWPTAFLFGIGTPTGGANSSAGGVPTVATSAESLTTLSFSADTLNYTTFNQALNGYWLALGH